MASERGRGMRSIHVFVGTRAGMTAIGVAMGACVGVMLAGVVGETPVWLDVAARTGAGGLAIMLLLMHRSIGRSSVRV